MKMLISPPKQGGVGDLDVDGDVEEEGPEDGIRLVEGDSEDDGSTLGRGERKGEGIGLGAEDGRRVRRKEGNGLGASDWDGCNVGRNEGI